MSGTAKRLAEAANQIVNPQPIAEAFKTGDKVKVPHKGKMVSGKVVRYDDGGTDKARQSGGGYVVDVGEYGSITVPSHKIVKEAAEQVDETSKARRLGQTVGAILRGKPTPSDKLKKSRTRHFDKWWSNPENRKKFVRAVNTPAAAKAIKDLKHEYQVEQAEKIDELSKATKDAYVAKRGSQLQKMTSGLDKYRNLLTGKQQANAVKGIKQAQKAMSAEEELIGGQKKLDVNKNKRLDAQDFKLLRAKKTVKEESAEITEAPYTPANDYEGEMAMTQLKSIMEKASDVLGMMKPEAKMEAWVQSKITLADEHISCVRDYLKHTDGAVG